MQGLIDALEQASRQVIDSLEGIVVSLPTLVAATLVVLVFVLIANLTRRAITDVGRLSRLDPMLQELIERLITVAIIVFGIAVGLKMLGLNAGTIAASFGVVGLIVGFALKDLLENFIAGIMILWRRPFKVMDHIRVGSNEGIVQDITFRTTTLRTPDGVEVLIPNAQVFTQAVHNFTHTGSRRTTIVLEVPAGSDIDRAREVLCAAARRVRGVWDEPAPEVLLLGGGADAYELHLRYWTAPDTDTVQTVESAVRQAALASLAELEAAREAETAGPDGSRHDGQ